MDGSEQLVIVAMNASPSESLVAVFDATEFIFGHAGGHSGNRLVAPAAADHQATGHEGSHAGDSQFHSSSDIAVFGETWTLLVDSHGSFASVPSNREVEILAVVGALISFLGAGLIARLVASKREVEDELSKKAGRFDTGFDQSPIGVAELEATGAVVKANDAIGRMLGYSKDDLIGMILHEFVAEESAGALELVGGHADGEVEGHPPEVKYNLESGREVRATLSVGVALLQPDNTAGDLLAAADAAAYEAKSKGRDRAELFDNRLREHAQEQLEVANSLRASIERGHELVPHYQPIVDLAPG